MTAEEILELRTRLEMTQEELAEKLKVAGITVFRWESGTSRPRLRSLRQLRRLYRSLPPEPDKVAA